MNMRILILKNQDQNLNKLLEKVWHKSTIKQIMKKKNIMKEWINK